MVKKIGHWMFALQMLNIWNTIAFLGLAIYSINKNTNLAIIFIFTSIFYMFMSSLVIYDILYNKNAVFKEIAKEKKE